MNVQTAPEKPTTMSRLYDNSLNNTNLMSSILGSNKAKSGQYTSISSNGNESNYEPSQRSLIENSKKISKNTYGQKKQSGTLVSGGSTSASGGPGLNGSQAAA